MDSKVTTVLEEEVKELLEAARAYADLARCYLIQRRPSNELQQRLDNARFTLEKYEKGS